MYEAFYQLREKPFSILPRPRLDPYTGAKMHSMAIHDAGIRCHEQRWLYGDYGGNRVGQNDACPSPSEKD